jgi:hypothetical protein
MSQTETINEIPPAIKSYLDELFYWIIVTYYEEIK